MKSVVSAAGLTIAVVFFCTLASVTGFGLNYWKYRSVLRDIKIEKHKKEHQLMFSKLLEKERILPTSQVIIQPLDHFDPQIKGTYGQRYWVNSRFFKSPDGPVFLYVGGEGGLGEYVADSGAYVKFAETYGALIFAVEHRFYGQSLNDDGLKTEQFKYLSSQQALADLANFHLHVSEKYNLTSRNKWISFGGSYPGALSAWVRVKYPHLIHGSVASSAPVRALVNFEGYNDVVAKSVSTELVGGSKKCAASIKAAFLAFDAIISKGDLATLSRDFVSCQPLADELDVFQMSSNLADIFMGVVQYNDESPTGPNIKTICETMTNGSNAYQNLVQLNKEFLDRSLQKCSDNSWKSFIRQMQNETLDREAAGGVGMRQWTYQTCAQFGYYQTCDEGTKCLFSRHMNLSPQVDLCPILFNISKREVYDQVAFTNSYYGSDRPRGSRILFVNGLIDPWHALSVLKNISKSETAIVIPGTAHCADMGSDSPNDPPALKSARERIGQQVGSWLSQKEDEEDKIFSFLSKEQKNAPFNIHKL